MTATVFPGLALLADPVALCSVIASSPDLHRLLGSAPAHPLSSSVACGEIVTAIYDLLEGTPLAPHTAHIVSAFLTHIAAVERQVASDRPRSAPGIAH